MDVIKWERLMLEVKCQVCLQGFIIISVIMFHITSVILNLFWQELTNFFMIKIVYQVMLRIGAFL